MRRVRSRRRPACPTHRSAALRPPRRRPRRFAAEVVVSSAGPRPRMAASSFNLVLGELTADQVAQGLAGKTGNPGSGGFWRPRMRVDEEVFLLDATSVRTLCLSVHYRAPAGPEELEPPRIPTDDLATEPTPRARRQRPAYMSCGAEKHNRCMARCRPPPTVIRPY